MTHDKPLMMFTNPSKGTINIPLFQPSRSKFCYPNAPLLSRRSSLPSTMYSTISASNAHSSSVLTNNVPSSTINSIPIPFHFLDSFSLQRYSSWLNLFFIFTIIGITSHSFNKPPVFVFISTFLGMLPLATILGKATEDVAEHTNDTIGALVNVTFGNAVELMIAISAMRAHRTTLIQETIVGSILSNLLLVLGSSFLVGGIAYKEQEVSEAVAENNANMLLFAVFGFSIPALFSVGVPENHRTDSALGYLSLFTSVILLSLYIMFMVFQLHTHADLYNHVSEDIGQQVHYPNSSTTTSEAIPSIPHTPTASHHSSAFAASSSSNISCSNMTSMKNIRPAQDTTIPTSMLQQASLTSQLPILSSPPELERLPSLPGALLVLLFTVILVTLTSEILVSTLDDFSNGIGLRRKFIAIVLLPVVANAVEHMSAIMVAGNNKIDMSIGIACGSSLQMALFVAPSLVLISWICGYPPLCLNFQLFETVCLGFTVLLVNATLRDSRTNWLEGALLLMCYFILMAAFFFIE